MTLLTIFGVILVSCAGGYMLVSAVIGGILFYREFFPRRETIHEEAARIMREASTQNKQGLPNQCQKGVYGDDRRR